MTNRLRVVGAALAAFALACERPAPNTDSSSAGSTTPPQAASAAAPADTVLVEIHEWRVTLSRDTIRPGPVVFRVFNKADSPHEFEVENEDQEFEGGEIQPGAHVDVKAALQPSRYEVYCPLAGPEGSHANRGMRAYLHVR